MLSSLLFFLPPIAIMIEKNTFRSQAKHEKLIDFANWPI